MPKIDERATPWLLLVIAVALIVLNVQLYVTFERTIEVWVANDVSVTGNVRIIPPEDKTANDLQQEQEEMLRRVLSDCELSPGLGSIDPNVAGARSLVMRCQELELPR